MSSTRSPASRTLINADELPREVIVRDGKREFAARVRIDTPKEAEYFGHGGILQYFLRQLLAGPGARS